MNLHKRAHASQQNSVTKSKWEDLHPLCSCLQHFTSSTSFGGTDFFHIVHYSPSMQPLQLKVYCMCPLFLKIFLHYTTRCFEFHYYCAYLSIHFSGQNFFFLYCTKGAMNAVLQCRNKGTQLYTREKYQNRFLWTWCQERFSSLLYVEHSGFPGFKIKLCFLFNATM